MNLLSQLGLGPAARPIYELVTDLELEALTPKWLEQQIRNILTFHGAAACSDAVIEALVEVGFAGLDDAADGQREDAEDCNSTRRVSEDPPQPRGRLQ
ncbi:MAG: hypothetical protein ABI885_11020 [Gammaproteobacteria bacterium]